jgi:histidinol dehydrogenase
VKIFNNPPKETWPELAQRPQLELEFLDSAVRNVLTRVRKSGDSALREFTLQFDKASIENFAVSASEIQEATGSIPKDLQVSIQTAAANIKKFHASQKRESSPVETMPGVSCWRKSVAIDKVGIYIPGGSAPLFSTVLMLGIPAKLAGCREVILCTPPDASGKINAAILYTAQLVGITKIFKVGGAQAIAAMAYGTPTIPKVYKIFGPGNQYVTKAKQLVMEEGVAIDMPAGPSEVLVMADESANPSFVAADLLSQAEHGEDSQVILVVNNESLVGPIQDEIARQISTLPRKAIAERALVNSRVIQMENQQEAIDFINEYAPEHLIVNTKNTDEIVSQIINAGSIFLGNYSPEAIGDYASGTNHTLPTNGYAKAFAGVALESFMKNITYQRVTPEGIRALGPAVEHMAEAEQLMGHKMAVKVRLDSLNKK